MNFFDGGWCTGLPEYWYTWKFEKVDISWMCKKHDNTPKEGEDFEGCANHSFYRDTWNERLIGAVVIATIASIACWIKFPEKQIERV